MKKSTEAKRITTYKATGKNMKCNGFQFEIGKEYQHKENVEICSTGFHSCLNPFDTLNYYPLIDSRFFEVEIWGKTDTKAGEDSKICSEFISIKKELTEKEMNLLCVNYLISECEKTGKGEKVQSQSGYSSKQSQSGDYSQQSQSGDSSKQSQSGYSSQQSQSGDSSKQCSCGSDSEIIATGENNVAAAIGINSKIKGIKGTWITLAEYTEKDGNYIPVCVISAQIDGKKIKADTFYQLKGGKFVEAK